MRLNTIDRCFSPRTPALGAEQGVRSISGAFSGASPPPALDLAGGFRTAAPAQAPSVPHFGSRGGDASRCGFSLLQRAVKLSKKTIISGVLGAMLLGPALTGQLMHPGAPRSASSPIAMQIQERAQVPTGAQLHQKVDTLRARVPAGAGAAHVRAVRALIDVHEEAVDAAKRSDDLASSAERRMDAMMKSVGFDAKLGYAADWYWFGVPPEHALFHGGRKDSGVLAEQAKSVHQAISYARDVSRAETSKLLVEESPTYAELHGKYTLEHRRLTTAQAVREAADDVVDALRTAQHAITMRNITPKTNRVAVYSTRTVTTGSGAQRHTRIERYRSGSRTESNPTWTMWNTAAVAAKARAQSRIRELNRELKAHGDLLDMRGSVDPHLIGPLDFFGHPSFLVWSFDSADVSKTQEEAIQLRAALDAVIGRVRPVHDSLERADNAAIDARWASIQRSRFSS